MTAPTSHSPTELTLPRVRTLWITAYVLAMVGVAAGWFGPIQILLPEQAAELATHTTMSKETLLAVVTSYGAAASMLANPVWGIVSDRLRTRWGRRRPILVAGAAVGATGLAVLAVADTVPVMITGWTLVQIGLNGPLAALAAMIGDRVPEEQRGTVGALFGVAQIVGVVVGTAVAVVIGETALGYAALAVAAPALMVSLVLAHRESPTSHPTPRRVTSAEDASTARTIANIPSAGPTAESSAEHLGAAGQNPVTTVAAGGHGAPSTAALQVLLRPGADFGWAWLIRFLLNLVNALVLLYLYYYLADQVGVDDPGTLVLVLTLVNVSIAGGCAAVGGVLSDRWRRRRGFIAAGAGALAAGTALLGLLPYLPAVLVATVFIGAGWGLYVAVDMAVMTQVLPDAGTRAMMLGVANVAASLPQLAAPVLAAPIVTSAGGYPVLHLGTAGVALLALACLPRLRRVG
ncbi:MFS transporter [Solwaraspora sp. WMMA2056]|uniref:MFS transporter n=1 Tax=Solwaraspora sp. WMMA2056 TaxID=3015161 RepID=UPI00259B4066|nr:MFS transporter [Solwaraspora sp. WMMA2056]WJK43543.1 MFS transporter [Solwaraspora sp. WMMA2056]